MREGGSDVGELRLYALAESVGTEPLEHTLPEAARILREVAGATHGAVILASKGGTRDFWSAPVSVSLRAQVTRSLAPSIAEARTAHDEFLEESRVSWMWAAPLRAQSGAVGTVVLLFDDPERRLAADSNPTIQTFVAMLAIQIGMHRKMSSMRAEKEQQERWFGVMDDQLRVLDRERQKFVAVVNQSDTYMIVVNREHAVQWTNMAMTTRLSESKSKRNWIGRSLQALWDELAASGPRSGSDGCPVREAFETGVVVHAEFHQTRDGAKRNLYVTVLPIKGPDGATDEVLVMIQDLSDLQVLRRSEARYRLLFERSPDAMIMMDPASKRVVLANPIASELTGYESTELLGMSVRSLHHPDDWERARADYERVFREDHAVIAERVLRTKDVRHISANMSATRFDLDGRAVVLVEFQDITERKRLEENLRHSQKMEAVGLLAGGVAHDFNNILTIIMGQSEVLVGRRDDVARRQRAAESIHKAAMRGSLLTRQLLAFSRKDVLKPEVLDVRDVVSGIETMIDSLIGDAVTVKFELAKEPCTTHADRGQLEQVIMNLAVNARDAMPQGGTLRIEVTVGDRAGAPPSNVGRWVRLAVHDDGQGIAPEIQQRLFEPFFTTKEQGKGTGLGLSSAYGIVRDSGGDIEVASAPGKGTTFTVFLPAAASASPPAADATMVANLSEGSETILLVEDEDDLRAMAAEVLGMMGYTVLQAGSGEEALGIWKEHASGIDLLLTDVVMPGMSGGELVRQATSSRPDTKVLYMSGYTDDTIVRHGVFASAAAFIQKPFRLQALSRKVREVLDITPRGRSKRSVA